MPKPPHHSLPVGTRVPVLWIFGQRPEEVSHSPERTRVGKELIYLVNNRHLQQTSSHRYSESVCAQPLGNCQCEQVEWYLITDRGRIRKESPIPGTWDAAMAIHDWVQEQLRHKIFVIPVLVLTDMEPDAEIEALAAARNVAVHWGSPDNLVEHLVELAAERKVYVSLTSAGIAAEAELVLPGSTRAVRTPEPPAAPAHHIHIHIENLHVHVGPEGLTDLQEAPH